MVRNYKMSCTYFDAAVPGTGPMGLVNAPSQSVDYAKYNDSFNLSLRSKSDYNLNPQPEGFVTAGFPKSETNREGIYAIETDRGELSATAYTQVNANGQKTFQNRLQDEVRPTMKETTLYSYSGSMAPGNNVQQSVYSQFIPSYANIKGQQVRISGASNFGLRTATEYSYFAGPTTTGINGSVIQNPDAAIGKNAKPVPDLNVDGPGNMYGAIPDGSKFQNYRLISQPVSNGLKFNYNLETASDAPVKQKFENVKSKGNGIKTEWNGNSVHNYSQLLGKNVNGIENRYTSSYQIAPLLTNPLTVVWDPFNKGEIPALFGDSAPPDYAYMNMKPLPPDTWIGPGGSVIKNSNVKVKSNFANVKENNQGGYNCVWENNPQKNSSNAYILGIDKGIHNDRIEWKQGVNTAAGVMYNRQNTASNSLPEKSYGGKNSVFEQYLQNEKLPFYDGMYTTLGDPLAGYVGRSVNQLVVN